MKHGKPLMTNLESIWVGSGSSPRQPKPGVTLWLTDRGANCGGDSLASWRRLKHNNFQRHHPRAVTQAAQLEIPAVTIARKSRLGFCLLLLSVSEPIPGRRKCLHEVGDGAFQIHRNEAFEADASRLGARARGDGCSRRERERLRKFGRDADRRSRIRAWRQLSRRRTGR